MVCSAMGPVLQFYKGSLGELTNLPAELIKVAVT